MRIKGKQKPQIIGYKWKIIMDKSTIALVISGLSFVVSFWNMFRDRSRLNLKSKFIPAHPEYGPSRIWFKAINKGRRPIYIRTVGGKLSTHGWMGSHIGKTDFGLKLEEGQFYEKSWDINDIIVDGPDFEDEYVDIWIEDSHGKRYKVPDSKKYIQKLKASNKRLHNT